jgi:pyrroline-5-carboxylate reductase
VLVLCPTELRHAISRAVEIAFFVYRSPPLHARAARVDPVEQAVSSSDQPLETNALEPIPTEPTAREAGGELSIRPARSEDVGRLHELLSLYARAGLVRRRPMEELHRELRGFMVAELGGRIVGSVALRVHSPALAEIASLTVDEGHHGRGIGGRLIRAAVLRAHAAGVKRIFAFTFRERLFHQIGFRSTPITAFPQKLATDYGGFALAAGPKAAVVLDLETTGRPTPAAAPLGSAPAPAPPPADRPPRTPPPDRGTPPEIAERMTENQSKPRPSIAILGGGNLGRALAMGWTESGYCAPSEIRITRRNPEKLTYFAEAGFGVGSDNIEAVRASEIVIVAVQPQQVEELLEEIRPAIEPARHRVISVVSGISIAQLQERLGDGVPIVRAMPNTAVSIGQSMTCLSSDEPGAAALAEAQELFDLVGRTLVIAEDMMIPATALCACGVAFFLRSIRAASQGGIEIGFHPEEALLLAAQTAKGAAALVLSHGRHPESEIDQVTTPRGCTIAGLNEMEHKGFSSAMIKGILLSAAKAEGLYRAG